MAEPDETIEDIAANLLTGAMVFLLGAALATLLVWDALVRGPGLAIGLNSETFVAVGQSLTMAIFSFLMLRSGVRTVRSGLTVLSERRHRSPPAG